MTQGHLALMALSTIAIDAVPGRWAEGMEQVNHWLNFSLFGLVTVRQLLEALLVLVLVLFTSTMLKRLLHRYVERHSQINRSSAYTIERLTHYVLLIIGILWALNVAGIHMDKLAVLAGAIGVGLGFGLQAIFSNFISGLILLFERSLKVGDFVELSSGVHGSVSDIHIRATRITTNDNIDILVPNSEFVTGQVTNWTLNDAARRIKVPFGVAYGTDKELVKKAALEAAGEVPFTLAKDGARAPQVWLTGFGDSQLDFKLVVWLTPEATRRPGSVAAAYNWALHTALEKYAIEIPFPQRDLNIRNWPAPAPSAEPPAPAASPSGNDAVRDVQHAIDELRSSLPTNDAGAAD